MAIYFVSVDAIALVAATAKSVLEISAPSTDDAQVQRVSLNFDGTTATNTPVKVEIGRFSSAVTTATTITPAKKANTAAGASSQTVKHSTSTEGAGTASDVMIFRIPPTSGYEFIEPLGNEFFVAPSTFFRIRCTAAQAVNVSIYVEWKD